MNEKLIHIVYMNNKEVAEEVFYHDLDESIFPKAGINLMCSSWENTVN